MGVVLALLAPKEGLVLKWCCCIIVVFGLAGWVGNKVLPGKRSPFFMELPPLRLPAIDNVVTKAYTRMLWYFAEIIPVFILASLLLWLSDYSGVLTLVTKWMEMPLAQLGLPKEAAGAFLLGFFRRDYGAAGLYDLSGSGQLSELQLLVAAVTLTLFVPCFAQLMVMVKECGILVALLLVMTIILVAFSAGWGLYHLSLLR